MKLLAAALLLSGCWMEIDEDVARETTVLALGQITQPNEMGQYPAGALKVATNVFIRSPGVLAQSRQASTLFDSGEAGVISQLLVPTDNSVLVLRYSAGTTLASWWDGSTVNNIALPETVPIDGKVTWTRSRDRILVTTDNGPIMFDYVDPTSTAERTPRQAGLWAPSLRVQSYAFPGNALANLRHSTCVCLVRRIMADGYELVSAVSFPVDAGASTGGAAFDIQFEVDFFNTTGGHGDAPMRAGDIVEIYRTRSQNAGAQVVGGWTGGTSCDATFFQTKAYKLTNTDVANGFVLITDSTPDTGLGQQLYTNPGIGGSEATYISPPVAPIDVTFKGHSMLFNLTEVAQQRESVLGGLGYAALADPASWRSSIVGVRELTGTTTTGSQTITGISAAHMVGIEVGQALTSGTRFPFYPSHIIAINPGAGTITMNYNAVGAGTSAETCYAFDVIELGGLPGQLAPGGAGPPQIEFAMLLINGGTADAFVAQAASLAYFTSTRASSPVPSQFSFARRRANPTGGPSSSFTIRATNGQNYTPSLPSLTSTAKTVDPVSIPNGWAWSEAQLPDAWPPANRGHIGSGALLGAAPTRDATWVFSTDGLWRLSGNGGAVGAEGYDWRVDPVDSTLVLAGPQAYAVMRETVYAYTNRGLVAINDEQGVKELTDGVIGDLLPGSQYAATSFIRVIADLDKDEIWVVINNTARVWSYRTKTWVRNTELIPTTQYGTYGYWAKKASLIMNDDTTGLVRFFDETFQCWAEAQVRYQPLYFGDAFATKQWIDETWVFDPENGDDTNTIAVSFNGGAYTGDVQPLVNSTDARVTFMVPRDAPALAQSIAPGMRWASSTDAPHQPKCWGLSMRATIIGDQQTRRSQ